MTAIEFPPSAIAAQRRRSQLGAQGAFVAGGTALQLARDSSPPAALTLLDVTRVPAAQGISLSEGSLRIGAAVRLESLRRDALVGLHAPLLIDACNGIAALSVRHLATIGGNAGWGFGDTLPALLALGANVELAEDEGEPLAQWLKRDDGTLLVALTVNVASPRRVSFFEKVGHRAAFSPTRLTVALSADLDPEGRLQDARAAVSGAGLRARRLPNVELALHDAVPTDATGLRLRDACAADLAQSPSLARLAAAVIAGRLSGATRAG
ncbi:MULTISPECIES: xanthine dehydrogenase family protein subunit M [unclassified Variovorax]|uniref:FAD binding domain-containing protein n=1 Tax=unclassified Variovorax TaxID=663243 RepID=UPI001BD276FE|nr:MULTISPECIES: FAD binding domain-containing protein [unclassified Variovorax]